ncbi:hypothetical protein CC78DRAFT_167451 [Lojkania enalia]|uniref:Uncharacterized protein n=1 Tax=Lojkania enalia TaxID=147567 RepID=A0A9P4KDL0_9PLEO|nr:hypothetical protein CC78DRAFT_167451 [Didymosphaeria enalia]
MDSPARSVCDEFTDEELDAYFASYVPLSNLPTPPAATRKEEDAVFGCEEGGSEGEREGPGCSELRAQATCLANLVPSNVSPTRPGVPAIERILERAKLPVEIVAFVACILDALTLRFAGSWRSSLAQHPLQHASFNERNIHIRLQNHSQTRIPSSEIIIVAALSLAENFLDDRPRSNGHWAVIEAQDMFTAAQVEGTKMCVLRDMEYGLLRITEEMVGMMVANIRREIIMQGGESGERRREYSAEERRPKLSLDLQGQAVWMYGVQTPEPSP